MFEPNLSIDVSLLAIILGLHARTSDRNLVLVLVCCLFAHVLLTNQETNDVPEHEALGATTGPVVAGEIEHERAAVDTVDHFKTTVSSGAFDRQLSTPQTMFTATVLPATSSEANGKLASARNSFFESLVS